LGLGQHLQGNIEKISVPVKALLGNGGLWRFVGATLAVVLEWNCGLGLKMAILGQSHEGNRERNWATARGRPYELTWNGIAVWG